MRASGAVRRLMLSCAIAMRSSARCCITSPCRCTQSRRVNAITSVCWTHCMCACNNVRSNGSDCIRSSRTVAVSPAQPYLFIRVHWPASSQSPRTMRRNRAQCSVICIRCSVFACSAFPVSPSLFFVSCKSAINVVKRNESKTSH